MERALGTAAGKRGTGPLTSTGVEHPSRDRPVRSRPQSAQPRSQPGLSRPGSRLSSAGELGRLHEAGNGMMQVPSLQPESERQVYRPSQAGRAGRPRTAAPAGRSRPQSASSVVSRSEQERQAAEATHAALESELQAGTLSVQQLRRHLQQSGGALPDGLTQRLGEMILSNKSEEVSTLLGLLQTAVSVQKPAPIG